MKRLVINNVVRDFDEFKKEFSAILPDGTEIKEEHLDSILPDGVVVYVEDKYLVNTIRALKGSGVYVYYDRSYDIKTLEELVKFINNNKDWNIETYHAIERNGWEDQTGEEHGICSDGVRKVVFDANKEAIIINEEENK